MEAQVFANRTIDDERALQIHERLSRSGSN
jgi:hypothetical protein